MSTNDSTSSAQKLRLPEAELLTVTDAIPIGISVLAPDGTTLHVNRMALDRLVLTLDEVIGKGHLERTCHPDDLDRILDERSIGLSEGVPFDLEMRLLTRNVVGVSCTSPQALATAPVLSIATLNGSLRVWA